VRPALPGLIGNVVLVTRNAAGQAQRAHDKLMALAKAGDGEAGPSARQGGGTTAERALQGEQH